MSVSHHLTDETILEYAAGSLSLPMETLVACHLTVCNRCRRLADLADHIGGELLNEFKPVNVSLSPMRLLAQANRSERATSKSTHHSGVLTNVGYSPNNQSHKASATRHQELDSGVPKPLARLLPTSLDALKWQSIAPGIKKFNLDKLPPGSGTFQLLHLAPGTRLFEHSHNAQELTFLVQGSYSDLFGQFRAGDVSDNDMKLPHRPVVDSQIPCIALIATQSPVRFTSLLGKILQPFVGF